MIKTFLGLPGYDRRDWVKALAVFMIFVALFVVGGVFGA